MTMEPTYRIDLRFNVHQTHDPWDVAIVRLSDERHCATLWAASEEVALAKAKAWIAREEEEYPQQRSYYVNSDGTLAGAGDPDA